MELETKAFPKFLVRTAVVITTISERGISNAAPFSFNSPISFDPPLYGFSCNPAHDTWRNIQENGEFVVNIVGKAFGRVLHILETDYLYEDSEIAHAGLTEEEAKEVKPPRIKEALAWIECKLEKSVELGDHIWITGNVVKAEVKDEFWKEAGVLDVEKAKPLCHITGEFFAVDMKEAKYKRAK
jgi:flavin reductase (DIM6/NTAB) family NADH-FMN oxidoreductase RutF